MEWSRERSCLRINTVQLVGKKWGQFLREKGMLLWFQCREMQRRKREEESRREKRNQRVKVSRLWMEKKAKRRQWHTVLQLIKSILFEHFVLLCPRKPPTAVPFFVGREELVAWCCCSTIASFGWTGRPGLFHLTELSNQCCNNYIIAQLTENTIAMQISIIL